MPNATSGYPVVLTANAVLPIQGNIAMNPKALTHDKPMEIHEIKFLVYSNAVGDAYPASNVGGAGIACQFTFGQTPITNGPIPLFLFSRCESGLAEAFADNSSGASQYMAYRWKLDAPLFVPAGKTLLPTFVSNGLINSQCVVEITYSGKILPAGYRPSGPARYPYVCAYTSKAIDISGAANSDVSREDQLSNVTTYPFHCLRMIGRLNTGALEWTQPFSLDATADAIGALFKIRMVHSAGYQMIKDRTLWGLAFPFQDRSWATHFVLSPGEYLKAYVDTIVANSVTAGTLTQANISAVGYLEG